MYQVLSSYFPCIKHLSRTCIRLVGSNGDLLLYKGMWPNYTSLQSEVWEWT